ncbi:transposase [Microbispora rosea]|uniref:transposase n=1 Tax=Microbispora rosea TaxID=58117 RepID=UPI00194F72C3|nr:transposase [Microbispora rosea]
MPLQGGQIPPPEFRRRVLDLLKADRTVQQVAADLQISDQTSCNWRRQDRIDAGPEPGITSSDLAELVAARRRIGCDTEQDWLYSRAVVPDMIDELITSGPARSASV